jgi:hypothetical protein
LAAKWNSYAALPAANNFVLARARQIEGRLMAIEIAVALARLGDSDETLRALPLAAKRSGGGSNPAKAIKRRLAPRPRYRYPALVDGRTATTNLDRASRPPSEAQ